MSDERKPLWPWIAVLLLGMPVLYLGAYAGTVEIAPAHSPGPSFDFSLGPIEVSLSPVLSRPIALRSNSAGQWRGRLGTSLCADPCSRPTYAVGFLESHAA